MLTEYYLCYGTLAMLSVYHSTALSGWQLLGGEFHGHELTLTPPML